MQDASVPPQNELVVHAFGLVVSQGRQVGQGRGLALRLRFHFSLEKRGKIGILSHMIEVSTTQAVNEFHRLLNKVERGETIRIRKHGRASARIVPDCDFMSGEAFASVFAGYKATALDKAAADAIAANIAELDAETDHALAH